MDLDNNLKNKIDNLLEGYSLKELKDISFSIIDSYKQKDKPQPVIDNELKAKIYAATRMPATYKVVNEVLSNVIDRYNFKINSSLDVGAGLGAASLALYDLGQNCTFDLYEKEDAMIKIGSYLLGDKPFSYHQFDIRNNNIDKKYDLVMASYVLNELSDEEIKVALDKIYEASNDLIIIIEPGTPIGSKIIQDIRTLYLSKGAHILAPCPHEDKCPMLINDWCHFATRVQRNKMHKMIKEAAASFEDEKYSYIVFSKKENYRMSNRILRHPMIYKGLIKLTTCSNDGIKEVEIRKNHQQYKVIKKLKSGDSF